MEKMKPGEFEQIFDLMELSFPKSEYRDHDQQEQLLADPHHQTDIIHGCPQRLRQGVHGGLDIR